jgi:hypothetical protein|nr:hypothetical protein Q903MT_gene2621 [Picea sitchensis]
MIAPMSDVLTGDNVLVLLLSLVGWPIYSPFILPLARAFLILPRRSRVTEFGSLRTRMEAFKGDLEFTKTTMRRFRESGS